MFCEWDESSKRNDFEGGLFRRYAESDVPPSRPSGNPNPSRFVLKKHYEAHGSVVVLVHYPDCLNYEGDKIVVYKDMSYRELSRRQKLDPHFAKRGLSPIARFAPTDEGWQLACKVLALL